MYNDISTYLTQYICLPVTTPTDDNANNSTNSSTFAGEGRSNFRRGRPSIVISVAVTLTRTTRRRRVLWDEVKST